MDLSVVLMLSVSLFFILDPFASIPAFISVTKDLDKKVVNSYANKAVLVAAILLFVFMFLGDDLMKIFGITIDSFRAAGGLILTLMGLDIVFSLKLTSRGAESGGAAWVIIATPILTGPGVITASILFSTQYGIPAVLAAGLIALFFTWIILRLSGAMMKKIGSQVIDVISKVIGLFIAAMGVEYMFHGAADWFLAYLTDIIAVAMQLLV